MAWWTIAVLLFAVLVYVVHSFIGTFVFGIFIYYATRPVYRRIDAYIRPPSLAAALSLLVLALPALLLLTYTVAVALQELSKVSTQVDLGELGTLLDPYIDLSRIVQNPEQLLNEPNLRAVIQESLNQALNYLGFIGIAALHLFVMILIAFYLLRDDRRLASWFRRRFADSDGVVVAYGTAVDRDFQNIFFGNILNAMVTGVIGALAYNGLNQIAPAAMIIPYPTLLGMLTGVASLIPIIGMKLVYFPVAGYLTYVGATVDPRLLWFVAAFVAVSFVIVDAIPDLLLRPWVSGRGLHLGMVMFAYIFGPLLFGWYGIFLGPMLLVFIVHFVQLVLPELLAGHPLEPDAVGGRLADRSTGEPDDADGDAADDASADESDGTNDSVDVEREDVDATGQNRGGADPDG